MTNSSPLPLQAVVIGASAGGVAALQILLAQLSARFPVPILIAQHLPADEFMDTQKSPKQDKTQDKKPDANGALVTILGRHCALRVKEVEESEKIQAGIVYLAAANYHLLVEKDATLSLSVDAKVCYSRPSIDILFESAAQAFGSQLVAVILSGAGADGSEGIKKVAECGGITIVQDPNEAAMPSMPRAALASTEVHYVRPLASLGALLGELCVQSRDMERIRRHAYGS